MYGIRNGFPEETKVPKTEENRLERLKNKENQPSDRRLPDIYQNLEKRRKNGRFGYMPTQIS